MDSEASRYTIEFQKRIPYVVHLGIETEAARDGYARLALEVAPHMANSFGTVHGGVILTLLDVAVATATRSLHPESVGVITLALSTTFLAAGKGRLIAEGRVLRDGRSAVFVEGEVRDAAGALVAKAIGTTRAQAPAG